MTSRLATRQRNRFSLRPGRRAPPRRTPSVAYGDVATLAVSWRRTLAAENKSPATLDTYLRTVRLFTEFLDVQGMPRDIEGIRREHWEAFVQDQLDRHTASTANTRYRGLQRFFRWAEDEGEIDISPMRRMRPPNFVERVPGILEDDDLRRLMEACRGRAFEARRDLAILLLLIDTGMRRGEVAGVPIDDLDLDQGLLRVLGKGGRERLVPLGRRLVQALDRYLRVRVRHEHEAAAGRRPTSCAWPAGAVARWWDAMPPARPRRGPARPIGGCRRLTGSRRALPRRHHAIAASIRPGRRGHSGRPADRSARCRPVRVPERAG